MTADLGASWDIDDYVAIKLWPGAHPLSGMVESAFTAARDGNVEPNDVAQILDAPRGSAPRGIEWKDVEAKYRELMPESRLPAERLEEILV